MSRAEPMSRAKERRLDVPETKDRSLKPKYSMTEPEDQSKARKENMDFGLWFWALIFGFRGYEFWSSVFVYTRMQ